MTQLFYIAVGVALAAVAAAAVFYARLRALERSAQEIRDRLRKVVDERDEEKIRAERRAEALSELVGELDQLAYAASHDLRAPLGGIHQLVGFLDEDLRAKALSPETKEHLRVLRVRVKRMDALLTSMLEFSQVGRGDEDVEMVDVAELIGDIVAARGFPDGFTVHAAPDMPVFETAQAALEQVLAQLIDNAIKHHDRDRGRVEVSAKAAAADQIEFAVSDDGPGIPVEQRRHVFRLFVTLERRDVKEAAGMGLAIAKKRVELAGGHISIEGNSPIEGNRQRGAVFRFTWPRVWPSSGTVVALFRRSKELRVKRSERPPNE